MTQASCHGGPALQDPVPSRPQLVIAGNPNVGKTTLFNALTGSSAKVSNYPGITVEAACGKLTLPGGRIADLRDLPGTYSINARSAEEMIALDALIGLGGAPAPDAVIVCVDATQVARATYLLLQCQELGARCVVALTMVDEAAAAAPDPRALSAALGCEVVAVTARTRAGLDELRAAIDRALRAERRAVWHWQPGRELRTRLDAVRAALPPSWRAQARYGAERPAADDALALWALTCIEPETGGGDDDELDVPDALRAAVTAEPAPRDDEAVLARWAWLDREIPPLVSRPPDRSLTQRIDHVLLHRTAGFAAFIGVMSVLFMSLFWWAQPAIDAIEQVFDWGGQHIHGLLGDGVASDFIVQGLIGGVGTVMKFLPQILLLFLFLGFLEDCGYLARVAYLMDRIMRSMNLHGRAFVPMLSGFACAVPALMAARTMERRRDRILTMMVVPLMTCSARLPVYTLVIAALIPASPWVGGLLMVGMYLFSVLTALIAAWVLSRAIKPLRARRLPFVIELPPYRWPRLGGVVQMMWGKSSMFLREAGTIILACSVALWALLYFPHELPAGAPDYDAQAERAATSEARDAALAEKRAVQAEHSYGGRLGHAIEPAIEPLGFDWKIGVGIVGAFAAREVFVSTLGIVYAVGGDSDAESRPLHQALREAHDATGKRSYTPLVGLSLMIFFALACQCMSTLAVVRRETRSLRWPLFLFGYMTALAWVVSFAVYQGGRLLGFS
ncbi:MAG: ferrous iron transport protein B [Deltaproteobacteria bacterium]|nr:MAG: ferrous iron transport protein B [Deltaproteobacteria bacterium]